MILIDFAMALVVTFVCAAVVIVIVGWDGYAAGGWPTTVPLAGIFFLVVWAGGIWLTPLGPHLFGGAAAWIPFTIVGFIGALLWAATSGWLLPRTAHALTEQAQARDVVRTTLIVLACVVVFVTTSTLVLHYVAVEMPPGFDNPQQVIPREP